MLIVYGLMFARDICNPNSGNAFELKVTNLSSIKIYPTVSSGKYAEEFGVVVVGKSKTIGFSPFKLGDKLQISWEEGESFDLSYATIDTSSMSIGKQHVKRVNLIYSCDKKWVLKAFDRNNTEIGLVPQETPNGKDNNKVKKGTGYFLRTD